LLRLHRKLLATCCEPDAHPERADWQRRVVELLGAGVAPCVPQHTPVLPGGVPLVGAFVPPGSFLMGGTEYDDEKPVHRATLTTGYFLGAHPVTQAQWQAVMGTEPSQFKGPNKPVESVSCSDSKRFYTKLTRRLNGRVTVRSPTEAQWEWACRAGTTTHFHFGDVPSTGRFNYNGTARWNGSKQGKNRKQTTDVGSFAPNPWGLFDLHGNVWEWCAEVYASYAGDHQLDPGEKQKKGSAHYYRVLRGGVWCWGPEGCRAASRYGLPIATPLDYVGFRVCFRLD
jgi:formylglycine-generating enzyme required for sulfatase activity